MSNSTAGANIARTWPEMRWAFDGVRPIGVQVIIPPLPSAEYLRYHATLGRLSAAFGGAPLSPADVEELEREIRELPLDDRDRDNFTLNLRNAPRCS